MIEIAIALLLLLVSAVASSVIERRHFVRIEQEEAQLSQVLIFNEKQPPPHASLVKQSLVSGSVVLGASYFKTFVTAIQGIFGGRLGHYESSIEGARREALIRLRRAAHAQGANMVINVRLETSSISKQGNKQTVGAVEILAYGTALHVPK